MSYVHPSYSIGGSDFGESQMPITYAKFLPLIEVPFIRIGDGITGRIDKIFHDSWKAAKDAGKPRAAWLYFRAEVDPIAQADLCLTALVDDPPEVCIFGDFENWKSSVDKTPAYRADSFRKFTAHIEEETIRKQWINPLLGVYTSAQFLDNYVSRKLFTNWDKRSKWVAQYLYGLVRSAPNLIPADWIASAAMTGTPSWDWWQFSCTGHNAYGTPGDGKEWGVYSKGLDLDVWNGTTQRFQQFYSYGDIVIIPPKPVIACLPTKGTRIRIDPSESALPVIATATGDAPFPVVGTAIDSQGRIWYRIAGTGDSKYDAWVASWVCQAIFE